MLRIIRDAITEAIDPAELYEELISVIEGELDYQQICRSLLERYDYEGIVVDVAEQILSREY